ncbi:PREDICTED: formin-like protein 4 [Populus euphratica]|uniref:Formin-like protein n=1 Tax=Populus euphratica TaxID=75702 RepID=A0AAJ6X692_POPEU|nr:PREDICTED: formin-like protein 4 [Populus euphratica]
MFVLSVIPFSSSQSISTQNIETYYPFPIPSPAPPPKPSTSPNPTILSPSAPGPLPSSSSNRNVVKAVAATAASTFVVATLLFFLIHRYVILPRRRSNGDGAGSRGGQAVVPLPLPPSQFSRIEGNVKGVIVDENGLDVLYWRKLEEEDKKNSFFREERRRNSKSEPIQEIPLLRGKSSTSEKKVVPETTIPAFSHQFVKAIEKPILTSQPSNSNPPLTLSPAPPPPPLQSSMAIPNKQVPAPPPPPTIPAKKNQPPPPPPPKAASSNLPPLQKGNPSKGESGESSTGQGTTTAAAGNGQVKLKPLHWDKVNTNAGQSMVWDKIDGGSFRVDDNLMEALFGFVATNRKSPKSDGNSSNSNNLISSSSAQIVILDARKSQNMAIVLKSLAISRSELLDSLTSGQGLSVDTLEKLMRIAPTKEEESQILEFGGDATRLADAESFLYHLLKAIPTAFSRINAMLFRSNYDAEILHFKESLQILESGCKELRNRGLFIKLLEAILKAGNRMNAGTSRGNAQAFKLTSLGKLSDVKSMDGKTTLLNFVVEEVVRAEGKRCVLNRNRSLSRNSSQRSNSSVISEDSASKGEREKEYMMMGLPAVGGLSIEFSNVKKAAQIDYDTFAATCSSLAARAREVRAFMSQCAAANGEEGFVREMKSFLEAAEEELKGLTKEQTRVMDLVKKTTEYYHAGASKDQEAHALQLFSIIKDFLCMVDQVCIEITRNLQRRKTSSGSVASSPKSPASRMPVRFPNLPQHFMKEKSMNCSSESDSDF